MPSTYPVYSLPGWLTDEALLRDEAVLFGLSEARSDEKIEAIRLAFAALTAPLEKQIEQHRNTIGTIDGWLATGDPPLAAVGGVFPGNWFGLWPIGQFLAGMIGSLTLAAGLYAGTLVVADVPDLALLLAGILGTSGAVGTLLMCHTTYRKRLTDSRIQQDQRNMERTRQQTERRVWQQQRQARIEQLYQAEATLTQQQAYRDQLIHLFESEFDLARSLRHHIQPSYESI